MLYNEEFKMCVEEFEGRELTIVTPNNPDKDKCWLLKTEYFMAFPQMEIELLRRGRFLVYLKNNNRWGTNDDLDAKYRMRDYLVKEYGLRGKCVPVGMSCGGLHAVKQAARHPDMVSCLYLDAPVINIMSYPFGFAGQTEPNDGVRAEVLNALSLDMRGMMAYRDHPLDNIPLLIKHRIPVYLVWGEADATVPFEENGRLLLNAYKDNGVEIIAESKPGVGHHPHGPVTMQKAIDFIESHD